MGKITFILGGARSGKSAYALGLAMEYKRVAFIATCVALDKEMERRIAIHRKTRPGHWRTFEETQEIALLLAKKIKNSFECVVMDCLTLLVSNLIFAGYSRVRIENEVKKILSYLKKTDSEVIIISNEVGLGIVPDNKLARDFRDIAGRINQIVARESGEVFFMVSGIPIKIK